MRQLHSRVDKAEAYAANLRDVNSKMLAERYADDVPFLLCEYALLRSQLDAVTKERDALAVELQRHKDHGSYAKAIERVREVQTENAALAAEVEELKEQHAYDCDKWNGVVQEKAALVAENARLREIIAVQAGDLEDGANVRAVIAIMRSSIGLSHES